MPDSIFCQDCDASPCTCVSSWLLLTITAECKTFTLITASATSSSRKPCWPGGKLFTEAWLYRAPLGPDLLQKGLPGGGAQRSYVLQCLLENVGMLVVYHKCVDRENMYRHDFGDFLEALGHCILCCWGPRRHHASRKPSFRRGRRRKTKKKKKTTTLRFFTRGEKPSLPFMGLDRRRVNPRTLVAAIETWQLIRCKSAG